MTDKKHDYIVHLAFHVSAPSAEAARDAGESIASQHHTESHGEARVSSGYTTSARHDTGHAGCDRDER